MQRQDDGMYVRRLSRLCGVERHEIVVHQGRLLIGAVRLVCAAEGDLHIAHLQGPCVPHVEAALAKVGQDHSVSVSFRAILQLLGARAVPGSTETEICVFDWQIAWNPAPLNWVAPNSGQAPTYRQLTQSPSSLFVRYRSQP